MLHELGHALGAGHCAGKSNVMYPYYNDETVLSLSHIDVYALQVIYEEAFLT